MKNKLGMTVKEYQGAVSTLCTGCGHDSVTNHIVNACFKSDVRPQNVVKISGIGCSSKTPAYFLRESHGFNTIHGRMASVATGAYAVNKNMKVIGISGDGDTASIGLGGYMHMIRRQTPVCYIIENNGVYGLTKGQFSATADRDSLQKTGEVNPYQTFDLCALAIEAGAGFVARSFSGDAKLLVPLLQAAMDFPGTAVIDVISPCIMYANHEGSTRSYDYVRQHKLNLQELGFVAESAPRDLELAEGDFEDVKLTSGRDLRIRKLRKDYDHRNRATALQHLYAAVERKEILTGLIYFNPDVRPLGETLRLPTKPLRDMTEAELRPSPEKFEHYLSQYR